MGHRCSLALAVLCSVLFCATNSPAATFVIDATGDAGDNNPGDGVCDSVLAGIDCTLRAAVQEANALAGRDRIEIPTLTISLDLAGDDDLAAVGDLDVTDALDIAGVGFSPTVSQISGEVIFNFLGADGSLTNLILQGGSTAIQSNNSVRLEITDLEIEGLDPGGLGIISFGTIDVQRVDVSGAGSTGIFAGKPSKIDRVTVTNSEPAIFLFGGGVISNALLYGNNFSGGPNYASGITARGDVLVQNVTLFGNCGVCDGGTGFTDLWIENGEARVRNSLFQTFQASPFMANCRLGAGGSIVSEGGNTEISTRCGFTQATDVQDTTLAFVDFGDGIPVLIDTRAIDSAVAELCPLVDLHGGARPTGDGCDRGAIEVGSVVACANGLDDDGDGFVDLQDPGCRGASDELETHARPGDVLASNFSFGGVSVFDPITTRLSPVVRTPSANSWNVETDKDGRVLLAGYGAGWLFDIDLEDGGASLLSAGGALSNPTGIALSSAGEIFVGEETGGTLLEIDPTTGAQTIIASDAVDFELIKDLVFEPGGDLLVSTPTAGIHQVDPVTGTISTTFTSDFPQQLDIDLFGDALYSDSGLAKVPMSLDLGTGVSTPLLSTPSFNNIRGVAQEPTGLVLVTDRTVGEISRVDSVADTATTLNVGREQQGIYHLQTVPAAAELKVTLSDTILIDGATTGVADIGDTLEFTAVVTNIGLGTADLLTFESGLDPNLQLVASSLSTTQGAIIEGSLAIDPRLEVDLGSLAPAATATITWQVDVADPAPARSVSANAWVRRAKIILAESDDPTTGPANDENVIGVGDYGIVVQATQKISDTRGALSGAGDPGSVLLVNNYFGGSLEAIGDVDGDGVEDVAVGAYFDEEAGTPGSGAFFILLLNSDGSVKQRFKWSAVSSDLAAALSSAGLTLADDQFGSSIAHLGDLDGGGPSDFALAVGAWYDDGLGGTDRGAVYILFMDASPLQVLSVSKIGDGAGGFPSGQLGDADFFGMDIENAGDIDGDGVVDLAVGAHLDDTIGGNSGGVWILFLTPSGTVKASPPVQILVSPAAAGDFLGLGIASLGLFDGDAVPDLAVGASRRDAGGTDRGAVWILTLNANGTIKTQTEIADGVGGMPSGLLEDDDRFGRDVEVVPDLDGNGTVDLIVGANRDSDAANRAGAVYALFLTPSGTADRVVQLAPQPGVLFNELGANDRFGLSIASLGDLDSDGDLEIAVGALLDDDGEGDAGAVYVLNTATPVPEPGAILSLVSGAALIASFNRRRKRR